MTSLSERDMKWLRSGTSRSTRWGRAVMAVTPVLYVGLSGFYLWMASLWARLDRLTFAGAWHGWLSGIQAGQNYPGLYLKAMEQFDAAALALFFAVLFAVLDWRHRADLRRRARLLTLFEGAA